MHPEVLHSDTEPSKVQSLSIYFCALTNPQPMRLLPSPARPTLITHTLRRTMSHLKSVPQRRTLLSLLTLLCLASSIASAQKRPITAKDFDTWRTLTGQVL